MVVWRVEESSGRRVSSGGVAGQPLEQPLSFFLSSLASGVSAFFSEVFGSASESCSGESRVWSLAGS